MVQDLHRLKETASQTAGPYVHIGMTPNFTGIHGIFAEDLGKTMVNDQTKGERIRIVGRVIDGAKQIIKDAVIEVWQADAEGFYNSPSEVRGTADPNFAGWGRFPTDMVSGEFVIDTVKPGKVPFMDGRPMAPHLTLWIVARGINIGLHTRLYFSDEAAANEADPVMQRIELLPRRETLVARKDGDVYRFDIVVQGEGETVFFDI